MIEVGRLYIKNSVPFKQVDNLALGEEYVNEKGHCIKYLGEDSYELVKRSPLRTDKFTISDLTDENAIELFWTLLKNE